jgi:hypothetical protein
MVGLISQSRVYADSVDHYLRCFNVACRPDCGRQPQRYGREPAVVLLFGSRSFDMLQPGTLTGSGTYLVTRLVSWQFANFQNAWWKH